MKAFKALQQRNKITRLLVWSNSIVLILIISTWGFAKILSIPIYDLVADPAEIAQKAPYAGLISQVGILLWTGTVCICWFSASILRKNNPKDTHANWSQFLQFSGYITALFLLDDLLQIHEYSPILLGLGSSPEEISRPLQNGVELAVFALYGVLFLAYLWRFKRKIVKTNLLSLILAIAFMGISTLIDLLAPEQMQEHFILEEGSKLMSIMSWFNYFFLVSQQRLMIHFAAYKFKDD